MLKAMWDNEIEPKPSSSRTPKTSLMFPKICTKNSSIMTAMVTSGMMIGRYSKPSNVR